MTTKGHYVFSFPIVYNCSRFSIESFLVSKVGTTCARFHRPYIKVLCGWTLVTLQGQKSNNLVQAKFHQLRRLQNTHAIEQSFMLQYESDENLKDQLHGISGDVEPKLTPLLHTYRKVFGTPIELPREIDQNHVINLVHGVDPVKLRSYRYSHNHKNRIEKIIQEMLKEGLIKLSNNPFSYPVVLFKKNMGLGSSALIEP